MDLQPSAAPGHLDVSAMRLPAAFDLVMATLARDSTHDDPDGADSAEDEAPFHQLMESEHRPSR